MLFNSTERSADTPTICWYPSRWKVIHHDQYTTTTKESFTNLIGLNVEDPWRKDHQTSHSLALIKLLEHKKVRTRRVISFNKRQQVSKHNSSFKCTQSRLHIFTKHPIYPEITSSRSKSSLDHPNKATTLPWRFASASSVCNTSQILNRTFLPAPKHPQENLPFPVRFIWWADNSYKHIFITAGKLNKAQYEKHWIHFKLFTTSRLTASGIRLGNGLLLPSRLS